MRKHILFRYLRVIFFLSLAPLVYLFWEWGGAESLLTSVKAPVTVNAVRLGTPAPEVEVPAELTWVRKDFRLSSLRGYPVVLHFWATWCGPCLQELPEMIALAQKLRPEGVSFVAVAIDDSWATVEKFFTQYPALAKMTDHMVLVLDPKSEIAKKYGSSRFPETFLINDQLLMDNKFIGAQPWNDPGMKPYLDALRTTK
jgi:thiol-disulfide isomerase/thioredoxin